MSYGKLSTEFYDIDKPAAPAEALAFYLRHATEANGPILEPMCGSGRFLAPLARHGLDIDGVDTSRHMLEACRRRCHGLARMPSLHEQPLHELSLPRSYELAFIPEGSFHLIADLDKARESLKRLWSALRSGGRVIMEIENEKPAVSGSWPWGGRWVRRADGALFAISWLSRFDAETSIAHSLHRYERFENGQLQETELEELSLRKYTLQEVLDLLRAVGFGQLRAVRPFDGTPADATDPLVVLEGRKE